MKPDLTAIIVALQTGVALAVILLAAHTLNVLGKQVC